MKTNLINLISVISFVQLAFMPLAQTALAGDQPQDQQLVTVTGQQDPKFSVPVNSEDMQKVADGLQGLSDLPTVTVDVNDLFHPGDEEVIKAAAKDISNKFVTASMILIDLRTMIYKLSAIINAYPQGDDLDAIKKAYAEKFSQRYLELLTTFVQVDQTMNSAITNCKSELCVGNVAQAQRQIFAFGKAMNDRDDYDPTQINAKLCRGSIEQTYQQMSEILAKDGSSYNASTKAVMSVLVSSNREKTSMKQVFENIVGKNEDLKKLGLKVPVVPKNILVTETAGLNDLTTKKLASLASGGKVEPLQGLGYFNTHVLSCAIEGGDRGIGHWVVYADTDFICTSSRNPNQFFHVSVQTYGPGLAWLDNDGGAKATTLYIESPTPINELGTWVGVGVKVVVALGGQAAQFVGKHGSTLSLLGWGGGWGGAAGVEVLKIKLVKEKTGVGQ